MSELSVFEWLQATSMATAIRESTWLFPTIETLHVLALALVVGSIVMVDLRLLGLANRNRAVSSVLAEILPWTWAGFAVATTSGLLLFSSAAMRYSGNALFVLKMGLLLLAGVNMAVFHLMTQRSLAQWDAGAFTPASARASAAVSLSLWISIVALGRWVGFV